MHRDRVLLLRHLKPGLYDFWAPPGGGVAGAETLEHTAERETLEETGLRIEAQQMAYIDELIDASGRMAKFWFVARLVSGVLDPAANPDPQERIVDARWATQNALPDGHVFPAVLRDRFWRDQASGFAAPVRLPLMNSVF